MDGIKNQGQSGNITDTSDNDSKDKLRKKRRGFLQIVVENRVFIYMALFLLVTVTFFALMCIDTDNAYRMFETDFLDELFDILGVKRENIAYETWHYFFFFAGTIIFLIICSLLKAVIRRKVSKNPGSAEKNRNTVFNIIYWGAAFLIIVAVFIILAQMGRLSPELPDAGWRENGSGEYYGAPIGLWESLPNLAYTVFLFLGFVILVPFILFLIYLLIKTISTLVAWLIIKIIDALFNINGPGSKNKKDGEGEGSEGRGGSGESGNFKEKPLHGDVIFPCLTEIDRIYTNNPIPLRTQDSLTLVEIIDRMQSFLANRRKLYYDKSMLRSFIAGMGCSRLMILQGLSGTGKSSLPRFFMEFIGLNCYFCAVQATWRDRTDLIGYYNDFSKDFKETNFLKKLYEASYMPEYPNLMVLDEFNLSRIEYYFADFLSVLEYPVDEWKIALTQTAKMDKLPALLKDGQVNINLNTWFIGTANRDDSTFTITDKVYDRAIILDFSDKNPPIAPDNDSNPISLTTSGFYALVNEALENAAFRLNDEDLNHFAQITNFIKEQFELAFGNRIMNQIEKFVPIYVACGGTKEDALDFMLARKILRKLEGKFDDYIKDGLDKLLSLIMKIYGKGQFCESTAAIINMRKKLI